MLRMIQPVLKRVLDPFWHTFQKELRDPRLSQHRLLKKLIHDLSATEYGRSLRVKADDGYDAFSAHVPVAGYDEIRQWVERQKSKEGKVLVAEPVLFYEKTSGSNDPAKYIPYTRALKNSFNRMFLIWLRDLLANGPGLDKGKTFISISPAFKKRETTGRSIRIGLDDDSDYLAAWVRLLLRPYLVLPPSLKRLQDPLNFKHALSALMVAESNLEIISIWNPSFLGLILDYIQENYEALCADLKAGSLTREKVVFKFKPTTDHRLESPKESPAQWTQLWPDLKLISCWASAHAAGAARRIQERFPGVYIQGKGLLATEAPLTLPLIEAQGFVPLPAEVFYEFLDTEGNISLLDELETGREYEIILSQKGGLCRYRIGDRVRVTHFYEATPCMEFLGRSDAVSDMVGEKLNETFVQGCLARLCNKSSHFQTLLPVMRDQGASYYLLVVDRLMTSTDLFETQLEKALCEGYHYRNARLLGQLRPARARIAPNARDVYYKYFMDKGMRWGDIKHQYLIRNTEDASKLIELLNPGIG